MFRFLPQETMADPNVLASFERLMKGRYSYAQLSKNNPELADSRKTEMFYDVLRCVLNAESLPAGDAQIQAILADPRVTTALNATMDFQYTYVQLVKKTSETAETEKNNHWADVIESIKWAALVNLPVVGAVPVGSDAVPSDAIVAGQFLMVSQQASAAILALERQALTNQLAPANNQAGPLQGDTFDDIPSV
jgi:hypothetical protein